MNCGMTYWMKLRELADKMGNLPTNGGIDSRKTIE